MRNSKSTLIFYKQTVIIDATINFDIENRQNKKDKTMYDGREHYKEKLKLTTTRHHTTTPALPE